jgi:hypothetical protein
MNTDDFIIDDRASGDFHSSLGTAWRAVSDTVMGGISQGKLAVDTVEGRACLRLRGEVSLENNGGFVQASLDLGVGEWLDASGYAGIELEVFGNDESYNLHVRTADTHIVWQSYRASFQAPPGWHMVRLPFAGFQPYRLETPLDLRRLKRIGLVAIGRGFTADLCVGRVALYRQQQG